MQKQRRSWFRVKVSPKSRSFLYFGVGIVLTGLILFFSSFNYSKIYHVQGGNVYRFGWEEVEEKYQLLNLGTIPQGLIGQQVEISHRFTEETNQSFAFHLLLIPGRENFFQDAQTNWRTDITLESLSPYSSYLYNFSYNIYNTTRIVTTLAFPEENAYNIVFWADSTSISMKLNGILVVDNYKVIGTDLGGLFLGIFFLITGLFIGIVPTIQFRSKNNPTQEHNQEKTLAYFLPESKRKKQESNKLFYQNFFILLKNDLKQVYGSPFITVFLPSVTIVLLERFREVYEMWGPSGGYVFGEFGTTIRIQGVILFIIEVCIFNVFISLFLFREQDEGIHKVWLALPFSKSVYAFSKFTVMIIYSLVMTLIFVGGTFLLIPFRNPTIGFQPLTQIWAPFLAYGCLAMSLVSIGLLITFFLRDSRYSIMVWIGVVISWFYLSFSFFHLQESFFSYFSIFSPERVIEYSLLRPLATDWVLESNILLYLNDTLLDPIFVLGFQIILIFGCFLLGLIIFRRRDL